MTVKYEVVVVDGMYDSFVRKRVGCGDKRMNTVTMEEDE